MRLGWSRLGSPFIIVIALLTLVSMASAVSGIFVGGSTIEGWVATPDEAPVEGARVQVVGMDEFNATTDGDGHYVMQVPYLEVGHTISFTHPDLRTEELSTGPLLEDGLVTVNATMQQRSPYAMLLVRILPWDQPGSNYGLRQDVMTVVNMTGTPQFEYSEKSAEEEVTVPAPGTYLVTGTRPGYYPVHQTVTVDRGDRLTVDLDMTGHKKPTYGWVNGSVEHDGWAIPFATVIAEPDDGSRTFQAVSGVDGNFSMQLPNGTFRVFVEVEGYATISEGVDVVLGEGMDLTFHLSVAQDTAENGNPLLFWGVLIAAIAILGSVISFAMVTRRRAEAEEAAKVAEKEQLRCPSCDAEASVDAEICASCGSPFPWKSFRCPECGAVMALDETRCPDCGNQTFDLHRG
jgi:hypothetical protein